MIANGATTTWEHWNGERSRIHNCYNGIGSWLYQAIGGIRPGPSAAAYQKVIIQPQIPEGVTWAKTSKETPYGNLTVNWETKGKTMQMELEIPVGVEAAVIIPSGVERYRLNGKEKNRSKGQEAQPTLKSGKYKLIY